MYVIGEVLFALNPLAGGFSISEFLNPTNADFTRGARLEKVLSSNLAWHCIVGCCIPSVCDFSQLLQV